MERFLAMIFGTIIILFCSYCIKSNKQTEENPLFLSYEVELSKQELSFFWKDSQDIIYGNFENLKQDLNNNGKKLVFAMNGGMYLKDQNPQGLYIEKGKILSAIDTNKNSYGNFYLQPNGIFYLTEDNRATICETDSFKFNKNIRYATQSGPMLLINGEMHSKFKNGSNNLHIRNGVGILPNDNLLFVMSKVEVNFYDFATYFKENGCKNALYLDGFVSRTYLPSKKWEQMDGNFGVIIGETKD